MQRLSIVLINGLVSDENDYSISYRASDVVTVSETDKTKPVYYQQV